MLMKSYSLILLAGFSTISDATTRVAVIELGKGGAVRRTTAQESFSTVEGVWSFWNALHIPTRRKLQHAGMVVVPDLFNKADTGLVIGISGSGVDLDAMPNLSSIVEEEKGAVGVLNVEGSCCHSLMSKVNDVEEIAEPSSLVTSAKNRVGISNFSGVKISVDSSLASSVDTEIARVVRELDAMATSSGKTIVVHLVIEENEAASRRHDLTRRLANKYYAYNYNNQYNANNNANYYNYAYNYNNNANNYNNGYNNNANYNNGNYNGNGNNGNNANANNGDANNANNNNANANYNANGGFYGSGYYNDSGEWVTNYKTMFQIQYFNVVLWSAISLTALLFFTIYLMMFMPLEPDTLLFGESAKLVGDD